MKNDPLHDSDNGRRQTPMSTLAEEIARDREEYRALCKNAGEQPQFRKDSFGSEQVDPYGPHAKTLRTRRRDLLQPFATNNG